MTTSPERVLVAAVLAAVLGSPGPVAAEPPREEASPSASAGPYLRVDLGFGSGRMHHSNRSSLSLSLSWAASLGWHASDAVAVHGSTWGASQIAHGWGAYAYEDDVGRQDFAALGAGATVRHLESRFFVTGSAGAAFLHAVEGVAARHDVHRGAAFAVGLRAGFDWLPDETGPAFGFSLGGAYLGPLDSAEGWLSPGLHVDLALTIATR